MAGVISLRSGDSPSCYSEKRYRVQTQKESYLGGFCFSPKGLSSTKKDKEPTAGDRLVIEDHPTKIVEVVEVALFSRNVWLSNSIKPKSLDADEAIAGLLIVRESPLSIYEEIL